MFCCLGKKLDVNKTYPDDMIILHQFPRGFRAPTPSLFALKLETWLRMTGIKYQNDFAMLKRSAKGKVPWITYKGEDICDSQFIIEFLCKEFDKDLSAHLSPIDKSIARAFLKLNEESCRWVGVVHRFRYGKPEDVGLNSIGFHFVGGKMLKEADHQGYGKHTKEELYSIGRADLEALETFIGPKKFLMGDRVCNEDASIFAMLCQVINHDRGPINDYIMTKCPNLLRYAENMKALYWPDWNDNITDKPKPK